MPCYNGPNPVKDEHRIVIWKWIKDNYIDRGVTDIDKIHDAVNQHFFGGQGRPEWTTDILSGRKTPFRHVADDMWKKQYNRRAVVQQAQNISLTASMGPLARILKPLVTVPRGIATAGHFAVFPISHGGDLLFRPASWDIFFKGTFRVYANSLSKVRSERILENMKRQDNFVTSIRSGLDVGEKSHPSGIINKIFGGNSKRAWDMLTVMRYELWDRAFSKAISKDPNYTEQQKLEIGKELAIWANHATGSGKGPIANLGGALFGPKLTQSKLNRMTVDPAKTLATFANWKNATPGQKAVAWKRLSGAAQYVLTPLGFLAANQGLISALGDKKKEDQINFTDPTSPDWMAFKMGGIEWSVPGMHTEFKTLGQIVATSWMTSKQLRGESRIGHVGDIVGHYGMGKLTPGIGHGLELGMGQNWQGRPLPWSSDPGTAKKPRMSWGEYLGSMGPIPLEGPIAYVYDHLKDIGASSTEAMTIIKGLIITGLGATGMHVQEVKPPQKPKQ